MVATNLTLDSPLVASASAVEKDANDNEAATDLSMNGNRNPAEVDSPSPLPVTGGDRDDGNMSTPDLREVNYVSDVNNVGIRCDVFWWVVRS